MNTFNQAIRRIREAQESVSDKIAEQAQSTANTLDAIINMDDQLNPDGSNYESIQNTYINQLITQIKQNLKPKIDQLKQQAQQQAQ